MPETKENKRIFSLLEVSKSIKQTLSERYTSSFWVKAEMNKLNLYKQSGNCYPELLEKKDGKIIAQLKGQLWKDDYVRINKQFLTLLKEPLKDGIKILFLAKISFDPSYGLALTILDIDPSFTLGDLEREKQESIQKLRADGLYDANKRLPLPLLPKRIAIISVESSKGYADFMEVLQTNAWNYSFFHVLFPSLLQGDNAVKSLIQQLKQIEKVKQHFDIVAIIRGGGGDVGLTCYNNYQLAKTIASFPIPVFTGIGHATNETVSEMISHTNAITPTKLAEYIIQKFHNFAFPVEEARKKIIDKSKRLLLEEKVKLQSELKLFKSLSENMLQSNKNELQILRNNLQIQASLNLKSQELLLQNIAQNIHNMNPQNVLKRGYSIVRVAGKAINRIEQVNKGETLYIQVADGEITAEVNQSKLTNEL